MELKDWKNRELEKLYINVFILEEETYVRIKEEIKKQKIYIFIGINLKGYKDIIGVFIPEEETTGYWMREISNIKERGIEELFMVSMINNKWIKKVIKMNYPEVIYAPSMIEIYNKTQNYIARKDHRIIMREISRIYKSKTKEEGEEIYNKLKELYRENKLLNLIIDKYIKEIFEMFKYSHEARNITSNTDSYNKIRNRIRWKIKKQELFENIKELENYLYEILKIEEEKWHPSIKKWDKIIDEMDCNLSEKILELI
jgi:putative transposase